MSSLSVDVPDGARTKVSSSCVVLECGSLCEDSAFKDVEIRVSYLRSSYVRKAENHLPINCQTPAGHFVDLRILSGMPYYV